MKVEEFIKELRNSAERIYNIYTQGSCYRLCVILQTIDPKAKAYWSDIDGHAITKVKGEFYDIGGKISTEYVEDRGYYLIPEKLKDGYYLLRYKEDEALLNGVTIEKYKK